MARVLGIDYGKQRIGVATTDPLQLIATPLTTVRKGEILLFLQNYLSQEEVEAIVVGNPLTLQGQASAMIHLVDKFVLLLKKNFPSVPIFMFDERFTSAMAQASRVDGDFKKKARQNKASIDAVSATFILRSFLVLYQTLESPLKPI